MRRSIKIPAIVFLFGVGIMSNIQSEETHNTTTVLGSGNSTCREFTLTYEHSPNATGHAHADDAMATGYQTSDYIQWLQGYLSAYNIYEFSGQDITSRTNMATILRFLYNWCGERPYDDFVSAIPDILEQIKPNAD